MPLLLFFALDCWYFGFYKTKSTKALFLKILKNMTVLLALYVVITGIASMEMESAPARRLFPSPKNTRNTRYPNNPTTMDGSEESGSIQILRNFVRNPFFAYIAR